MIGEMEIAQLIGTVGFPIVAFIMMFKWLTKEFKGTMDKNTEAFRQLTGLLTTVINAGKEINGK